MTLGWIYCREHLQVPIFVLIPNPEMEDFYPLVTHHMVVDKCTPVSVPGECMNCSHGYIHGLPTKSYSL